jgi:hypothetical protein
MRGYSCVRYDVFRDGEKTRELWVTDWDDIEGARAVAGAMEAMSGFYTEIMEAFSSMGGPFAGMLTSNRTPFESFDQIDGFPVVTRSFEAGTLKRETVLQSVTSQAVDAATFEPPAGYTKRTMGPS